MADGLLTEIQVGEYLYSITPDCDPELDETSERAVRNSVITKALKDLESERIDDDLIDTLFSE